MTAPAVLLLLAALALPLAPAGSSKTTLELGAREFEVLPEELDWEQLSPQIFDRRWVLPGSHVAPGRDLLVRMRTLLGLRFDIEFADGSQYGCFGDLVDEVRDLAPRARERWYAELERTAPRLTAAWGPELKELLFDERLNSTRWRPSKDHERDGLLLAETWNMNQEGAPWNAVGVRPLMEQAATLLHADLASIKAVENDYRTYPQNVGADYEEIFPLGGTYFVGSDDAGRPFSTLTIRFRCDLPFPFSRYTTRLGILNRFDAAGVLYTHIYSTSKDFYWLAGRDVFLPVTTSSGEWVAFLLVRHFGFDLDGIPDGSGNRREALRSSLGNLRRNAEQLYRADQVTPRAPRNDPDFLGQVRVFGRR